MIDRDKEVYKEKILVELFNSGELDEEVKKMCNRNKIKLTTYIHEDVISETFLYLSKKSPEYLIGVYEQGPLCLLKLACRIAIHKGFSKCKLNPEYHKHSLAQNILFASNLRSYETINETDEYDSDEGGTNDSSYKINLSINPLDEPNPYEQMWKLVESKLTKKENDFLHNLMYGKRKRGRFKKEVMKERDRIFKKIKRIINRHKDEL